MLPTHALGSSSGVSFRRMPLQRHEHGRGHQKTESCRRPTALPATIISGPLLIGPLSSMEAVSSLQPEEVLFGAQVNRCRQKAEATPCWLLQAAELDTELDTQGVIARRESPNVAREEPE